VRRRLERGLGHAYDGNAELGVDVSAKSRSAVWVQVNVAVHDDQAALHFVAQCAEHRPDGRQFAQIELAGPVGRNPGDDQRALLQHSGKRRIGRGYYSCPGTGSNVVDIHSGTYVLPVAPSELHRSTMDHVRSLASHPLVRREAARDRVSSIRSSRTPVDKRQAERRSPDDYQPGRRIPGQARPGRMAA